MASSSIESDINCDSTTITKNDDLPMVINEFYSRLSINIEKNKWTATCQLCSLSITDTYKTTSNFIKHLKNKHKPKYDQWKINKNQVMDETNQPKINFIFSPDREKYSSGNKRQQQLSNSIILNLIVSMGMPLSITDHTSFLKFMNDVDPRYQPINRRDITRTFLPELERKCISKLKQICLNSKHVSLTLDCWSDRRMRTFLGITMHTIIDNEYKSYLLSFNPLYGRHTGENIAAEFDRVIQTFDLKKKTVRLVTDNASNNLSAFDDIILPGFEEYFDELENNQLNTEQEDREKETAENEEEEEEEENRESVFLLDEKQHLPMLDIDDSIYQTTLDATYEDEYLRLPCFSHCLQLVVNDGIKGAGAAAGPLKKVADLAKLAHTSTIFADRMHSASFTVPKANRTRWNSQFQMVKAVLAIPTSKLNSILMDMKKNNLVLNTKDRKILEEFVALFELFNEATVLTQGDSYATITLVAPSILGILYDLERELSSQTLNLSSLCKTLISSIKSRFSGLLRHFDIEVPEAAYSMSERFADLIFIISPIFDARFKLLWLNNLKIDVKTRVTEKICNACANLFGKLKLQVPNDSSYNQSNRTVDVSLTSTLNSTSKRKCLFPYLNQTSKKNVTDRNATILDEINMFLNEESLDKNLIFKKNIHIHVYTNSR